MKKDLFIKGHDLFKGPDSYYVRECKIKKDPTNFETSKGITVLQMSSMANLKRNLNFKSSI